MACNVQEVRLSDLLISSGLKACRHVNKSRGCLLSSSAQSATKKRRSQRWGWAARGAQEMVGERRLCHLAYPCTDRELKPQSH